MKTRIRSFFAPILCGDLWEENQRLRLQLGVEEERNSDLQERIREANNRKLYFAKIAHRKINEVKTLNRRIGQFTRNRE